MKFIRYAEWSVDDWDDISLTEIMAELSEYLLQSGFNQSQRQRMREYYGEQGPSDPEEMLNELRAAIKEALLSSSLLSEEQWQQLFDEDGSPRHERMEAMVEKLLAELLRQGFLTLGREGGEVDWYLEEDENGRPKRVRIRESTDGQTSEYKDPAIRFEVTKKGGDFLGYKSLQQLLGGIGRASFGRHITDSYATGVEAYEATKPYEFGDTLNLDVSETLLATIERQGAAGSGPLTLPFDLRYEDLRVRQAEYQSSCATVLMLDCSHSMILYGEDRFTPAKQVALALSHLIRTQFAGDSLKLVLFHDGAEEIPLAKLPGVQIGPYHTNTCEGLRLSRRILAGQKKDMRQIIMITDGKPSAIFVDEDRQGSRLRPSEDRRRRLYKNSNGLDPLIVNTTLAEAAECKRSGIMINTFMLTDDYYLIEFVRELTEIAQGKAYFTNVLQLGQFVMYDFLQRKTSMVR